MDMIECCQTFYTNSNFWEVNILCGVGGGCYGQTELLIVSLNAILPCLQIFKIFALAIKDMDGWLQIG